MKTSFQLLSLLLAATLFTSCNNFGKRVAVDGTKCEVYYKGKGVSESDAQKLGSYLKDIDFFSNTNAATVQLTKQEDAYTVRFVYDKDFYNKTPTAETSFKQIGYEMSQKLFSGSKVNIALSDSTMNDFKTIPYDPSAVASVKSNISTDTNTGNSNSTSSLGPAENTSSLAGYQHENIGNIIFYWKDVSDADEKVISDYVVKNGSFQATHEVNIITSKEGERYTVRFPVGDSYNDSDAAMQQELEKVAQQIKDNVFANQPFSFIVTDTKLNNLKSWDF